MRLTKFVKPLDHRVIVANLCQMLRLFAAILVLPLVVSLLTGEFHFSVLFAGIIAGLFLLTTVQKRFGNRNALDVKEALAVTALSYLLFALVGALVFTPTISYIDGLFEAMSGFTTTGLTIVDVENLPYSLLFFRSYSQGIGGAGIVVLSLVLLVGPGVWRFCRCLLC